MVLTVAEILEGIEKYEEIEIKTINATIYLRPLSKSEWSKVDSIRQEALGDYVTNEKAKAKNRKQRTAEINSQLKFNIKKNSEADYRAQIEAIFLSLDNPGNKGQETTRDEIAKLPPKTFDEIYEKVCEISGIDTDLEDEVEEFPEDK